MNECEKLHNDLKAFLDGQLSPASRIALRLHLNRCESCRKELEEMRLLGTRLRADDTLEMSDALRARILASVPATAPEAKVKMLPRWREKPVLLWGASASAALAWFMLYPALNNYQTSSHANSRKTTAMGAMMYVQDHDEVTLGDRGLDVGKAPLSRNLNVYYATNRRQDTAGAPTDKGSPSFPYASGLVPTIGNGNGSPVGGAGEPHTLRGTLKPQSVTGSAVPPPPDVFTTVEPIRLKPGDTFGFSGERADRRSIPPSKNLLQQGVASGENPGHGVRRWTFPRTFAQNTKTEMTETDPSLNGAAPPSHTVRGTLAPTSPQDTYHLGQGYALEDLPTERQVHKEASLTVEVANAEQQTEAVERLVKESKGYVAQNQLSTVEDNTRQASLTCKVPVDQFDTVMGQIARLGLLKGKTLSGEDITEKVSDEQETGHVLRADIATTQEKLKTRRKRSETVHDEETLRQLRIRVAQSQARLKMLTRLGVLSEITVELDEKPKNPAPEVKPASPFMDEVSGTGQAAAHSFLMALRLPVQLLVWIVVYSPLWALLIYGYRRMTR